MTDKNQIILAIISTGLAVGGWLSADIRELRMKVDRNTEFIARLEGILIVANRPVPAQTALN